jgi:hypothetical protein
MQEGDLMQDLPQTLAAEIVGPAHVHGTGYPCRSARAPIVSSVRYTAGHRLVTTLCAQGVSRIRAAVQSESFGSCYGMRSFYHSDESVCAACSLLNMLPPALCHWCLQDPLAIIGLAAIFLPFLLLLVAIATGLVDVSVYR